MAIHEPPCLNWRSSWGGNKFNTVPPLFTTTIKGLPIRSLDVEIPRVVRSAAAIFCKDMRERSNFEPIPIVRRTERKPQKKTIHKNPAWIPGYAGAVERNQS